MASQDANDENPYLALREAKIARNQARLRELGLMSKVQQTVTSSNLHGSPKKPKRTHNLVNEGLNDTESVVPVRRSTRLSGQPKTIDFQEPAVELPKRRHKRPREIPSLFVGDGSNTNDRSASRVVPPRVPPTANSVRGVSLSSECLVLGADDPTKGTGKGLLGLPMDQTGKEFVMYKSFEDAASSEDRQRLEGSRLSFNKYSGVQEWKDCIFLWVNLGGKGNTVVNEFLGDGRQITWFGGSRMVDDSTIVEKLLEWGREAKDSASKVVLWCRRFETDRKTFGPYVCLGRLSYHSHEPGSYPLAFVWNLLDHERLRTNTDETVQEICGQFMDDFAQTLTAESMIK